MSESKLEKYELVKNSEKIMKSVIKLEDNANSLSVLKVYGTIEDPLFRLKDIEILLDKSNISSMISKFDENTEKIKGQILIQQRNRDVWIESTLITEAGLYRIIYSVRSMSKEQENFLRLCRRILSESLKQMRLYHADELNKIKNIEIEKNKNLYLDSIKLLKETNEKLKKEYENEKKGSLFIQNEYNKFKKIQTNAYDEILEENEYLRRICNIEKIKMKEIQLKYNNLIESKGNELINNEKKMLEDMKKKYWKQNLYIYNINLENEDENIYNFHSTENKIMIISSTKLNDDNITLYENIMLYDKSHLEKLFKVLDLYKCEFTLKTKKKYLSCYICIEDLYDVINDSYY